MLWRVLLETCAKACTLTCCLAALERRGARAQVDEPALREGLPLKRARWESYLTWAVRAFRLATVVAAPGTQVVTHLCYSEFADILHVRTGGPSQNIFYVKTAWTWMWVLSRVGLGKCKSVSEDI